MVSSSNTQDTLWRNVVLRLRMLRHKRRTLYSFSSLVRVGCVARIHLNGSFYADYLHATTYINNDRLEKRLRVRTHLLVIASARTYKYARTVKNVLYSCLTCVDRLTGR